MFKGARRLPVRWLTRPARRAVLTLCVLMAGLVPVSTVAQQVVGPARDVLSASYAEPTTRYPHGVLGDKQEWGALVLDVDRCPACARLDRYEVLIRLPTSRVFEDLQPRVVDLDSDGLHEVVVIESDSGQGARLAVYGPDGMITATPFIGRAFRWLAPLGAADLDGDGLMELAYIDRPHLAKTLRVWRYEKRQLTEVASAKGLTNHRIGQDFISGGIRTCAGKTEIITADSDWRNVMATQLRDGRLTSQPLGAYRGPKSLTNALACK